MLDAQEAGVEFNAEAFGDNFAVQMAQHMEPMIIGLSTLSILLVVFVIWRSYCCVKNYQI